MFGIVDAVLLRPLPYRDPAHLAVTAEALTREELQQLPRGAAAFYKNTGFSRVTLTGTAEPENVQGGFVEARLFDLLGVAPALGRPFTLDEETAREKVVLLSDSLWRSRFGADPAVAGRMLEIDGARFTIVGVMPASFRFPALKTQFWTPLTTNRYWTDRPAYDPQRARGFYARWHVIARLPAPLPGYIPLRIELETTTRVGLYTLLAAVFSLLLIAGANVANLLLARGAARHREMAIRTALGAPRMRLVRQLLTESLVLALAAGGAGLLIAAVGLRLVIAYGPQDMPRLEDTRLNGMLLAFTLGVSTLVAIVTGLAPALNASSRTLHSAGRARAALVVAEFAMTAVLLTGAGLLLRSFLALQAVDPGFHTEHVLTLRTTIPFDTVRERLGGISAIEAIGAINGLFELDTTAPATAAPPVEGPLRVRATWKTIRGNYLEAVGLPILRGRAFTSGDRSGAPLVAIVDESFARRYWPGRDAIGKQFRGFDARGIHDDPLTVVGLVPDVRSHGRDRAPTPHVYQPAAQSLEPTPNLVVRTTGDPTGVGGMLRDSLRSLDPAAILSSVTTLAQQFREQSAPRRFRTWLLTFFSMVALLLAAIGIYGVLQLQVVQRAKEMGIRIALGAPPTRILSLVLCQGLALAFIGLALGLAGSLTLARLLDALLFGIPATDPVAYFASAALLAIVAAVAVAIPAWRASRTDPITSLRQQ